MASLLLLSFLLLSSFASSSMAGEVSIYTFQEMEEKRTHLHFYLHDKVSPPAATAVRVASLQPNRTSIQFGDVLAFDDAITEGPSRDSKLLGRAQGLYTAVSLPADEPALLMAFSLLFTGGPYNGSTVQVLARLPMPEARREFPVVGGTGAFRLARGYVFSSPYYVDPNTGDSIVEYNVHVLHY